MGRSVEDVSYTMDSLFGYDEKDSTSVDIKVDDYKAFLNQDVQGLKIGVISSYDAKGVSKGVKEKVEETMELLKGMGATVESVDIKSVEKALPAYYIISSAEASSNLARFDGIRYGFRPQGDYDLTELYETARAQGFGREVKRRILLGTYALSSGYYDAYYKKAQQVRQLIKDEYDSLFETYDLILTPTAPTTAYELGMTMEDPVEMYMGDIFTVPVNIAGLPAISINAGKDESDMPVGVQFIAKTYDEKMLIQVGHALERRLAHD
jgi:aspartyl-tRNA(Asn)/glutamyl-tRNA(Gln) amidotransferase subunit A